MFGETQDDKRDKIIGLAGLTAGLHALRILAEKGLASPWDIATAQTGIKSVLDHLPDDSFPTEQIEGLERLINNIGVAAVEAEQRERGKL